MDLTPTLKPGDDPGVWIVELAGTEVLALEVTVDDPPYALITANSGWATATFRTGLYVPQSSAARQAWIDGTDDPEVLRALDEAAK